MMLLVSSTFNLDVTWVAIPSHAEESRAITHLVEDPLLIIDMRFSSYAHDLRLLPPLLFSISFPLL